MLCYAALFFEQNIGLYTKYMSKILWSVMLSVMLCYAASFYVQIWCSKRVKSYALLCCVMICYTDLFYEQNPTACPREIVPRDGYPLWVDRLRLSVPGFFAIWTTQIWDFLESASTQRGAHLSLSSTHMVWGVPISHFPSTQVFLDGHPSLTFHQP